MHPQHTDILTLHRFNGEEAFSISDATALAMPDGDTIRLNLGIQTASPPLKTLPDTLELGAEPNAEVTIRISKADLDSLAGKRFSVPKAWDDAEDDHVATFYYCEHEDLDENEIEFIEQRDAWLRVKWTGTTVDVNFYDGSKPSTRVVIEAWFALTGRGSPAGA